MRNRLRKVWENMQKPPRMIQVTWDDLQREHLLQAHTPLRYDNTTLNDNQFAHHVTLAFKPNEEEVDRLNKWAMNNDVVQVTVTGRFCDDVIGAEALTVSLTNENSEELHIDNKILHITLSTDGVPPVKSNDMLSSARKESLTFEPMTITGKVKYIF